MKKACSVMNYILPQKNIASMHCSANVGKDGDVAVFFGLSGTGKTTLSNRPEPFTIGDDEHGWDDDGCSPRGRLLRKDNQFRSKRTGYLSSYQTQRVIEKCCCEIKWHIDFNDASKTENTRVSYPIHHIPNIKKPVSKAGHASKVIISPQTPLVLPPVSILTDERHNIIFCLGLRQTGGTERGIKEPQPTFSACFGAAFLSLHPTVYADVLLNA